MRAWIIRFSAILLSVVLLEGLLQVTCLVSPTIRFMLLSPWAKRSLQAVPDPVFGHKGGPSYPEHDEWGYRNQGVPSAVDIVAIGDSQTYGWSVENSEAWPKRLGKFVGKPVYNMGFFGWGPVQYRAALATGLSLRPRIVVLGFFTGNDVYEAVMTAYHSETGRDLRDPAREQAVQELEAGDPWWEEEIPQAEPGFPRYFLSKYSKIYAFVRAAVHWREGFGRDEEQEWRTFKESAAEKPDRLFVIESPRARTILAPSYRLRALRVDDLRIEEGFAITLKAFEQMSNACSDAGVKLVVLLIPTKELVFESMVEDPDGVKDYAELIRNEKQVRERLIGSFSRMGITVVDGLPALEALARQQGKNPYFRSSDGHLNVTGHDAVARNLSQSQPFSM
jgi:hypothetical protein